MKAVYKNLLALGLLFMIAVRIESPRTYSKPKIKVHEKIAVKIERLRTLAKLSNRDYLIRLDKKGYR